MLTTESDEDFGFVVEAELADDADQEDELCIFISDVTKGGLAHRKGNVLTDVRQLSLFNKDMCYIIS